MTERFLTIDDETLMNQTLAPVRFVVNGLLSQGLRLLGDLVVQPTDNATA